METLKTTIQIIFNCFYCWFLLFYFLFLLFLWLLFFFVCFFRLFWLFFVCICFCFGSKFCVQKLWKYRINFYLIWQNLPFCLGNSCKNFVCMFLFSLPLSYEHLLYNLQNFVNPQWERLLEELPHGICRNFLIISVSVIKICGIFIGHKISVMYINKIQISGIY